MSVVEGLIQQGINYIGTAAEFVANHASTIVGAGVTLASVQKTIEQRRSFIRGNQHQVIAGSKRSQAFGDDNLISNQKRSNPLYISLGTAIPNADGISKFLKHLQGSGQASSHWSGEMTSLIGKRSFHFEWFRHRMCADRANVTGLDYNLQSPNIYQPSILFPTSIARQFTTASVSNYPWQFKDGLNYFSPLNRADFEDMSWNLNKLKLGNQNLTTNTGSLDVDNYIKPLHPLMETDAHRKQSTLQQSNAYCASIITPSARMTEQPYIYDMHFKSGTVSYEFMNKGTTGAVVDIIVYRVKKNHLLPTSIADYQDGASGTPGTLIQNWVNALGQGYVQTSTDKFGTDDLSGRDPVYSDITTNPDYTFMKQYSKTKAADVPFAEVSRQSFSFTSGSRKSVVIKLPGDIYNPCDISRVQGYPVTAADNSISSYTPDPNPSNNGYPWDYDNKSVPLADSHTYVIALATTGEKLSRILSKVNPVLVPADPDTSVILDEYAPSKVQYYCKYTEEIGACLYSDKFHQKLFVRGARPYPVLTDPDSEFSVDAGLILELAAGVQQAAKKVEKLTAAGVADGVEVTSGGDIVLAGNR